ncbi:YibE/F family protein [Oscillospiraceae bacterium MB08-C2-2]|nr:YibE/F family protein [Oscillospiraceae bacterium MB08-C2-2]
MKSKTKNVLVYILTVVFAILYIFIGNKMATKDFVHFSGVNSAVFKKSVVTEIVDRTSAEQQIGGVSYSGGVNIRFKARVLTGENKGEVLTALQNSDPYMTMQIKEVEVGDKILLTKNQDPSATIEWTIAEYVRSDALIVLALVFVGLLLLFGRGKGLNTIISLVFTCLAIFMVLIPAILSGKNIYGWSLVTCTYIVLITLLIVYGANEKSLAAGLGCAGGVLLSGALTMGMDQILKLTGMLDEESIYLLVLSEENPIDLKAIIFAAIMIGAIGAIMDVSMSIASALSEVCGTMQSPTWGSVVKSGLTIGQDIMGTMTNTLILAYIGSSLSIVLLLAAYNASLIHLTNMEMIVVEILQSLIGSIGILFTLPLSSLICAFLYTRKKTDKSRQAA